MVHVPLHRSRSRDPYREHVPAQLRLRPVRPARQQQGDLHREAKRRLCPAAHHQAAGHWPGHVRVLHSQHRQPLPGLLQRPHQPHRWVPPSSHLTLIHNVVCFQHCVSALFRPDRLSRRRLGRCVFHRCTLWFYSRLNQTHLWFSFTSSVQITEKITYCFSDNSGVLWEIKFHPDSNVCDFVGYYYYFLLLTTSHFFDLSLKAITKAVSQHKEKVIVPVLSLYLDLFHQLSV